MARAASKPKKEISMEEALWKSADKLRGSVEPAEYKHVVLSLFFLKFASDKFEAQRKAISEKYGEKFVDNVAFYTNRSFRVSCFNWCCNAFSSLMAFRSFFSLFSSFWFSFSSFEVSGKDSVLLSRHQHINPVWFSNSLTHPHDKSGDFQFIQRTLDRHGDRKSVV